MHEDRRTQFLKQSPGQDAVYDNFLGLTGRRPITWTEFAKAHSAAFKQ